MSVLPTHDICAPHVDSNLGDQKRASDFMGLKLQMSVSHHVGA